MSTHSQNGPFTTVVTLPASNARDQYYRVGYGKNNREAAVVRHNPDGWHCRTCYAVHCPHVAHVRKVLGQ